MTKRFVLSLCAFALGLISLLWLWESISTYVSGLSAQSYESILARVSDVTEQFNPLGINRTAILSYSVGGKTYKQKQTLGSGLIIKSGETVDLFYDPRSPEHMALSREIDYDTVIVKGAFGLFGLCFVILMIKRLGAKPSSLP